MCNSANEIEITANLLYEQGVFFSKNAKITVHFS